MTQEARSDFWLEWTDKFRVLLAMFDACMSATEKSLSGEREIETETETDIEIEIERKRRERSKYKERSILSLLIYDLKLLMGNVLRPLLNYYVR